MANPKGLLQDPFSSSFAEELYFETPARALALASAGKILKKKKSLFVSGHAGSGRGWFVRKVASEALRAGMPVLFAPGEVPEETLSLLKKLCLAATGEIPPETLSGAAEKLYTKLLRRFWQGGTIVVVPGTRPLPAGESLREIRHLAGARVKGAPLASFVICGEGTPPSGFETVELHPFTQGELASIIGFRLSKADANAGLSESAIEALASSSKGAGAAMDSARIALSRLYLDGISPPAQGPGGEKTPERTVLAPEQVLEVANLLDAISSSKSS